MKNKLPSVHPALCTADNGLILGYDNNYNRRHRNFRGVVEPIAFESYEAIAARF